MAKCLPESVASEGEVGSKQTHAAPVLPVVPFAGAVTSLVPAGPKAWAHQTAQRARQMEGEFLQRL